MLFYSNAVNISWQIAAMEAVQAGFQFIEKEQILIGLLKIGDLLDERVRAGVMPERESEFEEIKNEAMVLEEAFSEFNIDRVKIRRRIRELTGRGNFVHTEKVIHRSDNCRKLFGKAEEIAQQCQSPTLRAYHLFEAVLDEPGEIVRRVFEEAKINLEELKKAISRIEEKEKEKVKVGAKEEKEEQKVKTPYLDRFGLDLTQLAREGKIDPVIGRRNELLQVVRTLSRKIKNNPILIGEAGVGKTAIVKALAIRIAQGNVAAPLLGKRIIELNMAGIVAGTKYRGEFEERLVKILDEAKRNDDVILFIDEFHTVIGAGSAEGSLDASNIMKPVLSSGEIRCIGATTIAEYRKYIEKDAAFERRFQPVMVNEPTVEEAIEILRGLKERYEAHHQVLIKDEALDVAVKLSVRYLPDRRLPDKALDIVDEAASRVKISSLSFYGKLEDIQSMNLVVTEEVVVKVIADLTGRPVERMDEKEKMKLSQMEEELRKRIIGQDEAVKKVCNIIKLSRAGLREAKRPVGVFLFLGPTGVGKTELAKALSEFLFGSENEMIRLDMSEYMEKHSIAKLVGAPPGYIGYEEEGQLTGRLRTHPYTVVLLDEIEKAHPDVFDLFLQLFDEGRLTDSKGRTIEARSAVFIMTSNIGSEYYQKKAIGFGAEDEFNVGREVMAELRKRVKPEFINRIDEVVLFKPLSQEDVIQIASLMLDGLRDRLMDQGIDMKINREILGLLAEKGYSQQFGARFLGRTIEQIISKPLAEKIIAGEIRKGEQVYITLENGEIVFKRELL